ncbi:hypothetical protein L7F22_068636, partial [Adiantum nelumboides]|nr:hypothetical protein [Adiantum nelumboides]
MRRVMTLPLRMTQNLKRILTRKMKIGQRKRKRKRRTNTRRRKPPRRSEKETRRERAGKHQ